MFRKADEHFPSLTSLERVTGVTNLFGMPNAVVIESKYRIGRPILVNEPAYPHPVLSYFGKPTNQPKDRTSYVNGPRGVNILITHINDFLFFLQPEMAMRC
jgi:hypothetical protein